MPLRFLAALVGQIAARPSLAQNERTFPACLSQQEIEEVTGSQGRYIPDECRHLKVVRVESGNASLCVLDFRSGTNPGILDKIAGATLLTQSWFACQDLGWP